MSNADAAKARSAAAAIVLKYGMPADREQLVARLAYAYALGARDGYSEAATFANEAWAGVLTELHMEARSE